MKTPRIEELVEELFQYYDDIDCATTVNQRITAKEQAELWLKRTITTIRQEAEEREAYEWFNRWYNSHVAKLSEEERFSFTHWATNRLQELGVHDEGKEEDTALIRSKIKSSKSE